MIARKRAELTTTEIDTRKLEELIAAAPQQDVKLARATTRAVDDEAIMEIVAQQQQPTRVAPAPLGPPRLAHTKRRQPTEGESFDDPTTVHTRTTGSIPVERGQLVNGIAVARGSSVDLPSAEDISAAVSTIVTNDSITAPASVATKLADGSDAMIAVEAKPRVVEVEAAVEAPTLPTAPSPMRARAIALSGVLAAAVVAAAWWLVH